MKAVAALALVLCACTSASTGKQAVLFSGTVDLPLMPGAVEAPCPETFQGPDSGSERVCLRRGFGRDPWQARDWYRRVMVVEKGWTRARSNEMIDDVWILPGTPTTTCLAVSAYLTVDEESFVELLLTRLTLPHSNISACDFTFD